MTTFKNDLPEGFDDPVALPRTVEQKRSWQEVNRSWWESHPMRYDWAQEIVAQEFTPEFYREIDRRFFAQAAQFLPPRARPFDDLIDFSALPAQDVLEIGVGSGSHAQLLGAHAKSFTGIDLTDYAVRSTSGRFAAFGLAGRILRMDAEQMNFPDASFDFIWSWGVIHHSADTRAILQQMHRVLRRGGRACVMIYHRNWWNQYVVAGFLRGVLLGELVRVGSSHKIMQLHTDGGIARFYTRAEWHALVAERFTIEQLRVVGPKTNVVPLPPGRVKQAALAALPDRFGRLFTNRFGMGSFLVCTFKKD